jgi:CheY-like chemotaxis protein
MTGKSQTRPVKILLVEDNMGDIRLTQETLKSSKVKNRLTFVMDGEEAIKYLRKQHEFSDAETPDLIILDLNLPKKDGREVLEEIKTDPDLRRIPVVVLTVSNAEEDVLKMYGSHANCYITKPLDLKSFGTIVRTIEDFWFEIVKLPPNNGSVR